MQVAHELDVLSRMADEVGDYVLAEPLFWQMQARSDFPKLTLGLMLLTRTKVRAVAAGLDAGQQANLAKAERQIDTALARWPVAAEKKGGRELHARLGLWRQFWDDCMEQPKTCGDNYPLAATHRAIAGQLLAAFARLADTDAARALAAQDAAILRRLVNSDFIWPPELKPLFPPDRDWYLYRRPAGVQ